ncbi:site-specific integrase [Streptomyces albicerus]|uniref:phage integrase family protein n=1 Tax=Streptomyces albicerus TaxID=2569859 RepID=UPI00124B2F30|nr:phage integrase family protein [Streptomyces albicerus]
MMDHDRRWALVNDLLHQQHISGELRVAGLFVLLFGQPLTRIVQLTVDDVHLDGPCVQVCFAQDAIMLPAPLTNLVRELIGRRGQSSFSAEPRKWLFPGGAPGRHLTTSTLGNRLRALGLPARAARNTALMQLAAHMPGPILASMIGITPSRAAAWTDLAKRDWAAYTAHRARAQHLDALPGSTPNT